MKIRRNKITLQNYAEKDDRLGRAEGGSLVSSTSGQEYVSGAREQSRDLRVYNMQGI
jgi:hypothetical protein